LDASFENISNTKILGDLRDLYRLP
jgi:hypothetical protein